MAKTNGNDKPGKKFVMVETSSKTVGKNREQEGGLMYPSGRFVLNSNGSDRWFDIVKQTESIDPTTYVVKFGVDKASMLVAAYPMPWGTPNASGVRLNPRKGAPSLKTVTLDLDGVFEEHPTLRPTGKRKIKVTPEVDADGRPYLEISLQTQTLTRTTTRSSNAEEGEAQKNTAAAKQKAKPKKSEQPAEPEEPGTENA